MLRSLALALSIVVCSLATTSAGAAQTRATARSSVSDQSRTVHHADRGLVLAGALTFSVAWALNSVGALPASLALEFSSLDDDARDFPAGLYWVSLIPVIGPIVWGAEAASTDAGDFDDWAAAAAFLDAGIQLGGLALIIAGLVGVDERVPEVTSSVRITPIAGGGRAGVGLEGTF